jgi:hypothetical protein
MGFMDKRPSRMRWCFFFVCGNNKDMQQLSVEIIFYFGGEGPPRGVGPRPCHDTLTPPSPHDGIMTQPAKACPNEGVLAPATIT